MNSSVINILIASVGGQGGLTLARVIAEAAVISGYSVRTGETLGMAQRYGSVVSFVRLGASVLSPMFSPGEADYLLGLELFESARNLHYLSREGKLIVADEYRPPLQFSLLSPHFSRDELLEKLKLSVPNMIIVPARRLATEAGNPRALNMVILGVWNAISQLFTEDVIAKAIKSVLPERALQPSIEAYRKGYRYARISLGVET